MMLRLAQDAERAGRTAWKWAVWLEGPREELEAVKEVVYTLHPTFPQPVHRQTDPKNKFRLEARGWGEFLIRARA
jgi:transcription initiation factor IIF auxiliary subunit